MNRIGTHWGVDVQASCGFYTVVGIRRTHIVGHKVRQLTHERLVCPSGCKEADVRLQMDGHHGRL
jgi:hypothetical protein